MTKKYILVGTVLVLLGTSGCSYIPTENISYGVYYNDTDLSNTPKNELQARLQEVNDKIPQTISIDMGNNKKQQATYHDLGIQFDTEAMVKAISTYGYEAVSYTHLATICCRFFLLLIFYLVQDRLQGPQYDNHLQ